MPQTRHGVNSKAGRRIGECYVQKDALAQLCLVGLFCAAFLTTNLDAQVSVAGSISGAVVDSSGAVIPGATITITNEGTGMKRMAVTNASGSFVVVGFVSKTRTGVVLTANERLSTGDIELAVGTPAESVTVSGESVHRGHGVWRGRVRKLFDLMVKGRDWMNVIRLLPGVATAGGGDVAGGTYGTASTTIGGIPTTTTI